MPATDCSRSLGDIVSILHHIRTARVSSLDLKPRLHDTTGCQTRCQTGLTTGCIVYTNIQPVVKAGSTNGCIVYTAGCQTGCTTRFHNRLNEQWLFVQHGCQIGCTAACIM